MQGYSAYSKSKRTAGWTRIELLLAVYDKALGRLDLAEAEIKAGRVSRAIAHLAKAQLAVSVLAGGVRAGAGNELGVNMLRLYDFAVRQLATPTLANIASVRKVLTELRKGFEAIRLEANALERTGKIPSGDQLNLIQALA